jgi:diguanylate cyclase (GGDEF)-like protein
MIRHFAPLGENRLRCSAIRRWTLWTIPVPARAVLLAAEAVAAAATVWLLAHERPTVGVASRCAVLLAVTIGYAELAKRFERIKRYLGAGRPAPGPNPLSVWSFAAVLTLPAGWAAGFIAAQYGHALLQRRRDCSGDPYRVCFTAAAAILGQLAAAACLVHDPARAAVLSGGWAVGLTLLAAAVFTIVDIGVLLAGMWLTARRPALRSMVPDADALGYEAASLVLGIATAALLLHNPVLAAVMVIPVAYLHRSSMVKSLHQAARTDSKTGLLNSSAWTQHARGVLSRCQRTGRPGAVLLIDLDHFKAINDNRGHLVGDQILLATATCLQHELRGHDGLGRFGGDEFVVILDELDLRDAEHVAHRLHAALESATVEDVSPRVSIGLAHTDDHGTDLDTLLSAADAALYAAKAAGRGRLRIAPQTSGRAVAGHGAPRH